MLSYALPFGISNNKWERRNNPMLSKIFKPKWQHRNADVRIAALGELDADDPVLLEVAGSDDEPKVRCHALRRIDDLPALIALLGREHNEDVRECVRKRLKCLFAGEGAASQAPSTRRQLLPQVDDEEVLGYVLRHAVEIELRHAALSIVSRPSMLAEVALADPSGDLRLAAVERIERDATLERVARQAKGKDKRVARRARERLESMRMESERPRRQQAICEELEQLVVQGGVDLVAFGRLQKAWQAVLPAVDELGQRFEAACRAFDECQSKLKAEAALTARQRELCERIEELRRTIEQETGDLNGMDSAITLLQRAWQGLEEEGAALNPSLVERFHHALQATEQRRREKLAQGEVRNRLQAVVERLQDLKPGFDAATLKAIEAQWREAGGNDTHPSLAELQGKYKQLQQQLRRRLEAQGEERKQLSAEVDELLAQLMGALDEGQLQQAVSAHDKLRDRHERLRGQGGELSSGQQRLLHKAAGRLNELRDWRRFGTHQAREALLEQAQALASSSLEPLKLAEEVKRLRNEWRRLDRKDGPAGEARWQAFDQAMETAYAPCADYYEKQQQERHAHTEAREQLLSEIERHYEETDWENADWAAVEKWVHQQRKRWHKQGGVEPRVWRDLNQRFNKLLGRYEAHLGPLRESEKARREALIHRVEQLLEEPDLAQALTETKAAQAAWRPLVSSASRVEQGLWRRFKSACDAVFARQREQARVQRAAQHDEQAKLEQVCEEIASLASALSSENLSEGRTRLAELKAHWLEAQTSGVRRNKALMSRFDAAQSAFAGAEAAIEKRRDEAEQRLLLQKANACDALDALLFTADRTAEPERIASWESLPPLRDSQLERILAERFERTRAALAAGGEEAEVLTAAAGDNLAQRRKLYLQLELLSGIESPAAFAEERLAVQVAMLPGAMTGKMSADERGEKAKQLLVELLATGPVAAEAHAECRERLQAVLA